MEVTLVMQHRRGRARIWSKTCCTLCALCTSLNHNALRYKFRPHWSWSFSNLWALDLSTHSPCGKADVRDLVHIQMAMGMFWTILLEFNSCLKRLQSNEPRSCSGLKWEAGPWIRGDFSNKPIMVNPQEVTLPPTSGQGYSDPWVSSGELPQNLLAPFPRILKMNFNVGEITLKWITCCEGCINIYVCIYTYLWGIDRWFIHWSICSCIFISPLLNSCIHLCFYLLI